ncbi:unnamed protein product (macronuclear) [Paramecium tetraurelia]|uniref:EXS domain-containing protein n=1 Tax=Paramecium tetraurelia TaxID=5888 RepID=A0DA13_PARTE|nr:uncharacterized protein GSPATT00014812001 [Paramecium tetraurelia]CAK79880.1 unnamed protein product [Paramecium tetraurelia]|eukprot:XP_001447277.1 hypothetical protein (macronuclear) [Paramecium tetraurelia strain d4-2]
MTILKTFLLEVKQQKQRDEYLNIKQDVLQDCDLIDKLRRDSAKFIEILEYEIRKTISFSKFRYIDVIKKYDKLKEQIIGMQQEWISLPKLFNQPTLAITWNLKSMTEAEKHQLKLIKQNKPKLKQYRRKCEELQDSMFRFYVEVQQLQSFLSINYEATRKIIKKFKKQEIRGIMDVNENIFEKVIEFQNEIRELPKRLKMIKDETESVIIQNFYKHDNPKKCREFLRRYTEKNQLSNESIFYFGFFAGFATLMIIVLLLMRYDGYLDPNSDKVFNKVFPCFRGVALFIFYFWMISLDVAGWNYFNVNYKLYLGFNHHYSTLSEILKRVTIFKEDIGKLAQELQVFDVRLYPLLIWVCLLIYVLYPFKKIFNPEGKKYMYQMLYGMFWGFLFNYESRYTFMADQFASFTTPIRDLDYTICYYYYIIFKGYEHEGQCEPRTRFTSALPATVPYLIKCAHYLVRARVKGRLFGTDEWYNFLKTANAAQVGVWSFLARRNPDVTEFRVIWIFVAIISTFWQYYWDLAKDFLFFEKDSKYKFLRNDLGYNSPTIYYIFAGVNLVLRCTWVLSLSPDICKLFGIKNELFVLLVGFLEMSRRFLNNFLKVEKEHIVNLRSLKVVQDLKYPFQVQKELVEFNNRDHWSVSSFLQPNSGFQSLKDEVEFENRPSVVQLFKGLTEQIGQARQPAQSINEQRISQYTININRAPNVKLPLKKSESKQEMYFEYQQRESKYSNGTQFLKVPLMKNVSQLNYQSVQSSYEDNLSDVENKNNADQERDTLHDIRLATEENSIIEKGKKKESLERQWIKELKQENKKYKKQIYKRYEVYRVQKTTE